MPDTLNPLSSEPTRTRSTVRSVDTAATRAVLLEVLVERQRQIETHGWTIDHDDLHGPEDFAWLCARRAVEMSHRDAYAVVDGRRLFIEIAAIAVAAIEAIDRAGRR